MVRLLFVLRAWHREFVIFLRALEIFSNVFHKVSNRSYPLTCVLLIPVAATFAVSLAYFVQVYNFEYNAQLDSAINTIRGVNAASTSTDMLIAAVLTYLLLKHRSGLKKTDSIVNRLIIYAVCTGSVTALWSIIGLIGAVAIPSSFLYVFIDMTIAKCESSDTRGTEDTNSLFVSKRQLHACFVSNSLKLNASLF